MDLLALMYRGSPNREGGGSLASQGVQSKLSAGKQNLPSVQPAVWLSLGSNATADAAGEIKPLSLPLTSK